MYFSDGLMYLDKSDVYSLGLMVMKIFLGENKLKEFETNVDNIINFCLNKKGETSYFILLLLYFINFIKKNNYPIALFR